MIKSIGSVFKSLLGARSPATISCRYTVEGGCSFKGSRKEEVLAHEAKCGRRMVECPMNDSCEKLPVKDAAKHLGEKHNARTTFRSDKANKLEYVILRRPPGEKSGLTNCQATTLLLDGSKKKKKKNVCWLIPHSESNAERAQLWMYVLTGDHTQLDGLKCRISMSHEGNEMEWIAPVYPVGTTREYIRSTHSIDKKDQKKFEKEPTEEQKKRGFSSVFNVTFQLVDE